MAKKKVEVMEEVKQDFIETVFVPEKPKPSKIEFNFGNGDLNILRDKLNEIIDSI